MQQVGRMEIDLFAQDNMCLQALVDTALAAPGAPRSGSVRPPCLAVILGRIYAATYLTLGAKTMPLQVYYYLYQGNWFDTAVAATLMTVPVLLLSAFLQRYLRETSLAGVMR